MFNEATALTFPVAVPTPVYRAIIDKRVEVFGNCCPPIPWTQFVTRPFTLTDRQIQNEIERERESGSVRECGELGLGNQHM